MVPSAWPTCQVCALEPGEPMQIHGQSLVYRIGGEAAAAQSVEQHQGTPVRAGIIGLGKASHCAVHPVMAGVLHIEQCLIGTLLLPERCRISKANHIAIGVKAPTPIHEQSRNQEMTERRIRACAWIP